MLEEYSNDIKKRAGIMEPVNAYNDEVKSYLLDCEEDMIASGVTEEVLLSEKYLNQILTAATLYVKAHIGNDRTDTDKYLELYQKKVFRLTLEGDDGIVE